MMGRVARRDGQPPAGGHGHRVRLAPSSRSMPRTGSGSSMAGHSPSSMRVSQPDRGAQRAREQPGHRPRIVSATSTLTGNSGCLRGECEELRRQPGPPFHRLSCGIDQSQLPAIGRRQALAQQFEAAEDRGQKIVEIMRPFPRQAGPPPAAFAPASSSPRSAPARQSPPEAVVTGQQSTSAVCHAHFEGGR